MKNLLLFILAAAFVFTACQTEKISEAGLEGDSAIVSVSLYSPDALLATRSLNDAANSALGGFSNLSLTDYSMRYKLAVYLVEEDGDTLVVEPQVVTVSDNNAATFSIALASECTYKFVAWADFVTAGSTEDLHYNTEDLSNIYCIDTDACLNDESRDAYFVAAEQYISTSVDLSLSMARPFAKLRVVTTDYDTAGLVPDEVSLSYYGCTRFTALNALTGEVTGESLAESGNTTYTGSLASSKEYSAGLDADDSYRTLLVDYLLAQESEQTAVHFTFASSSEGSEIGSVDVSTSVPIQRNYLTTVSGALLGSDGVTISVDVDIAQGFTDEYTVEEEEEDETSTATILTVIDNATLAVVASKGVEIYYDGTDTVYTYIGTYTTDENGQISVELEAGDYYAYCSYDGSVAAKSNTLAFTATGEGDSYDFEIYPVLFYDDFEWITEDMGDTKTLEPLYAIIDPATANTDGQQDNQSTTTACQNTLSAHGWTLTKWVYVGYAYEGVGVIRIGKKSATGTATTPAVTGTSSSTLLVRITTIPWHTVSSSVWKLEPARLVVELTGGTFEDGTTSYTSDDLESNAPENPLTYNYFEFKVVDASSMTVAMTNTTSLTNESASLYRIMLDEVCVLEVINP